jgi:hypothetical protein
VRRIDPSIPPEVAQRILNEEYGDLKARWILNDLAEDRYRHQGMSAKAAAATLIHAGAYLADREEYSASPWPKNMVKLTLPPACRHTAFRGKRDE